MLSPGHYNQKLVNISSKKIEAKGIRIFRYEVDFPEYYCNFAFLNTNNYPVDVPLVIMDNHFIPNSLYNSITALYREKIEFFHLTQTIVQSEDTIVLPTGEYLYLLPNDEINRVKFEKMSIEAQECYEVVIFHCTYYQFCYGHILNDILGTVISLPKWVWDLNPVVISKCDLNIYKQFMDILGYKVAKYISGDNFVYGEHVFICKNSDLWHSFGITTIPLIKQKIFTI